MSRENLPTNYVNYELATAMGGMRRFNQINNSDGTISFEDATTYSTTGTTYGASEINTANALINEINELVGVTSISGSGQTDITSLLGGTDITESTLGIGDGTVTGAISELNSNLTNLGFSFGATLTTITTTTTYTPSVDAVVFGYIESIANVARTIKVDENIVARSYSSSGNTSTGVFAIVPKGSTLATSGDIISLTVKKLIIS